MKKNFKDYLLKIILIIPIVYFSLLFIIFIFQRNLLYEPKENNYFGDELRVFLNEHKDKLVINKLCRNTPVTETDLKELEKILLQLADDNAELINRAKENSEGLGLFVRSLVGLERIAATEALSEFLNDKTATSSQINFLNLIVEELTKNGAIKDDRLYESPFVDITPTGPESIFDKDQVNKLFTKIEEIRLRAIA